MNIYETKDIYECIFLERLNRFVARVILVESGEEILVHVKNTGRCKELLIEGRKGYLLKSHNENRKYKYDLISIYKENLLINIDSQIPNKVVFDFINNGLLVDNITKLKKEVTFENSRFDIYFERLNEQNELEKVFMEVKGVTLFDGDLAKFPDAPTERGTKHLLELVKAKEEGYRAYVFFLIQGEGIKRFRGNFERDENFCNALKYAKEMGVEILCFNCEISKDNIKIKEKVIFEEAVDNC